LSHTVIARLDRAIHAMTDQQDCRGRLKLHPHGMDRRLKADDDVGRFRQAANITGSAEGRLGEADGGNG
jgi:hypothetical protein